MIKFVTVDVALNLKKLGYPQDRAAQYYNAETRKCTTYAPLCVSQAYRNDDIDDESTIALWCEQYTAVPTLGEALEWLDGQNAIVLIQSRMSGGKRKWSYVLSGCLSGLFSEACYDSREHAVSLGIEHAVVLMLRRDR